MNSLFAYVGDKPCRALLWQGLLRCPDGVLSGLAVLTENEILVQKAVCPAGTLRQRCSETGEDGSVGIAATTQPQESPVTDAAAAPYTDEKNGLVTDGCSTAGEAQKLLQRLSDQTEGGWLQAMKKHLTERHGSVIVLDGDTPSLCCRAGLSPLYVAIAEHGFFVTNELTSLPEDAVRFHLLKKGESARITRERVTVFDARLRKIKKPLQSTVHPLSVDCQPFSGAAPPALLLSVKAAVNRFIKNGVLIKEAVCPLGRARQRLSKVVIVGSGDAYFTAAMTAPRFTALADLPAAAYESSDPALSTLFLEKGTLLIALSPGGRDDAATQCIERAKTLGATTLAVTANPCSQLALTAGYHLTLPNGNTIITAYLALSFLTLYLGNRYEVISDVYLSVAVQLATTLAGKVSTAVRAVPPLQHLSGKINHAGVIITTGIGADTATADIAAAMLRRTLQLPAYAQRLTLLADDEPALLRGALVLTFLSDNEVAPQALPPLHRLRCNGAEVVMITTESIAADLPAPFPAVAYPDSIPLFNPLICLAGFRKICDSANTLRKTDVI